MKVTLTALERRTARHLAECREGKRTKDGVKSKKADDKQSDMQITINGLEAELAFCKMMNLYPDFTVGRLDAADCTLPDGRTVDVKTTNHTAGNLLAFKDKADDERYVDLFALMIKRSGGDVKPGEFNLPVAIYEFMGWCPHDQLICDEALQRGIDKKLPVPTYFVYARDLNKEKP